VPQDLTARLPVSNGAQYYSSAAAPYRFAAKAKDEYLMSIFFLKAQRTYAVQRVAVCSHLRMCPCECMAASGTVHPVANKHAKRELKASKAMVGQSAAACSVSSADRLRNCSIEEEALQQCPPAATSEIVLQRNHVS
jgi:hypothetical protein